MILDFEYLAKKIKRTQPAAVRRWLKSRGVAFMADPDGKPVTTLDAFNRALYGSANKPDWTKPKFSPPRSTRSMAGTSTSTRTSGTRSHG